MSAFEGSTARPTGMVAIARGFRQRCPCCGEGKLFGRGLALNDRCAICNEVLGDIRTDDVPAYLTVLVVGHVVVPLLFVLNSYGLGDGVEIGIVCALALVLTFWLLPSFKGAFAGRLWSLGMRSGSPV